MVNYTCLYYWLIEPIDNSFLDTSESQPAFEVPIIGDHGTFYFALFVREDGSSNYARLTIPGLADRLIPDKVISLIQTTKEHLVSVLRITYHINSQLFPLPIWQFLEDTSEYSFGVDIEQIGEIKFDIDRARRLFIGSFPYRTELRLLIDGFDKRIQLQYRYLSIYKIIELEYKVEGEWNNKELEFFLEKYRADFIKVGVKGKPRNHIHTLRDKCAHVKTGKRKEVMGVTQLSYDEYKAVSNVLPVMEKIGIEILNNRAKGDYFIQDLRDNDFG